MQLSFRKMHGTGNDFLIVDQRTEIQEIPAAEHIRKLADRRTGIGFDQLMWISPSRNADSLAYYRVFNADGTEVEQCGNGACCVAWVVSRNSDQKSDFTLGSLAGPVPVRILGENSVAVCLGKPEFEPTKIPFIADKRAPVYPLQAGEDLLNVSVLSMGNPHCVLQVTQSADANIKTLGPLIETHERFPNRTNVGFMAIRNRNKISLRVHERGVGETMACGTGACAAVVAGRILGKLDENVEVTLPGGQLMVSWSDESAAVWLSGNPKLSYKGTLDL
jgi:diaminopimelate epimerase